MAVSERLEATSPAGSRRTGYCRRVRAPVLTLLMGLPGCGKTTIAQRLRVLAPHLVVLSRDLVRRELFAHPDYSAGEKRAVFDEMLRRAGRQLLAGRDVLIDGMTFSRAAERERAEACAEAAGAGFLAVHCDCPLEVALTRVRAQEEAAAGHPAGDRDEALVRQVAARFEPVGPTVPRLDMRDDAERLTGQLRALIDQARVRPETSTC
jgi:predicted kinase